MRKFLFFIFILFLSINSGFSATYYSIKDGDWTTGNIWSTDPDATTGSNDVPTTINQSFIVIIRHTVTSGGVQINNKGDIIIESTGYLDISSLIVKSGNPGASITIDEGGTLEADDIDDRSSGSGINNSGTIINPDCPLAGVSGDCFSAPLPVELLSFDANSYQGQIELSWATASELNNEFFTLEKSKDGLGFYLLSTIQGQGTTSIESNYDVVDNNPYLGLSFYRLSQTDFDGTTEVFPVVSVIHTSSSNNFTVSPNPITNNQIKLRAAGLGDGKKITLNIINLQGKLIEQKQLQVDGFGNIETEIHLSETIQKGTYIIELVFGSSKQYLKVIAE